MKPIRIALAVLAAALIVPCAAAKKKTPAQPVKPERVTVVWNNHDVNPDGTPADSTVMYIYQPVKEKANGTTVLMTPGGGYGFVSMQNEGYDWVEWFNDNGYTVAILNYRLPNGDFKKPITDAQRALGILKEKSADLGINPDRIGIMGFSAGGHLSAITSVLPLPEGEEGKGLARPAFSVLIYPVISMTPQLTHHGSRINLLGSGATPSKELEFSTELRVDGNTPPAFLVHANDDDCVNPANSIAYYQAMMKANRPVEMHIFPSGRHGFGFSENFPGHNSMIYALDNWLQRLFPADE